jgi:type VI secretion system secreted protein VgrG
MNRNITIHTPLGEDLKFRRFWGGEELSKLFNFTVELLSDQRDISASDMLGQSITIEIELKYGKKRFLNAQCTRFNFTGVAEGTGRFFKYQATLQPWLWYATRGSDFKVYQKMDVPSIVKDRLDKYPFRIEKRTTAKYPILDYCVQYRENDFDFVSRLMENEGIYYYFEHKMGEHVMVLCDSIAAHGYFEGYEKIPFYAPDITYSDDTRDHFSSWLVSHSVDPGTYATDEYDFKKPKADLSIDKNHPRDHNHSTYEKFDFPGGYTDMGDADHYSQVRMEELQNGNETIKGNGEVRGAAVGFLFALENHKRQDQNRDYLTTKIWYDGRDDHYESAGSDGDYHFQVDVTSIPSQEIFRPKRVTPVPRTSGSESAIITGPKGEEIYTDQYGRIKLQFHWDRYGTWDENSSCWIRVSSPWAGSNFGGIYIPRIGQEVLVDFINGNPDRPMVTHRVYNEDNMPPWDLPANDTQSGFLTRSTRGGAAGPGMKDGAGDANALRFDDRLGEEQLWIHAQLDQLTEVENDESKWVGRDRVKDVDRDETSTIGRDRTETVMHDETITVHNDRTETVDVDEKISIGNNQTLGVGIAQAIGVGIVQASAIGMIQVLGVGIDRAVTVGNDQTTKIGNKHTLSVGDDQGITVTGNHSLGVGKDRSTTVGGNDTLAVTDTIKISGKVIHIDAKDEIKLTVGGSTIIITGNDIQVLSKLDRLNC